MITKKDNKTYEMETIWNKMNEILCAVSMIITELLTGICIELGRRGSVR
jgi:hypothetical protein